jgi:2-C-methyl-D-erythritol 2,4-cyclodiphosphate synthase
MDIRVGYGYDIHQLVEGRELWLGGIQFEHDKGALGHSDADVLLHAICDAILGAAGLRDIGFQFPDTDQQYKGIDSKKLLVSTMEKISEKGWKVNNLDATINLERPKILKRVEEMKTVIGSICNIPNDCVSIKATTSEKLGFVGAELGVEASAVVLLTR